MNDTQRRAIQKEIYNLEDNLYRYELQYKRIGDWQLGDGKTLASEEMQSHRELIAKLKEGL